MLVLQVRKWMQIWEKCSYAHRQVDEQPCKRSQKNGDKSAVAMLKITRQLGCVCQDMEPPMSSSILRKSSNIRKPIRYVKFTKAVVRHAYEKGARKRGWILKNTRIGPVMDIKVCHLEDRYSIEILVQSLFLDRNASWVRIVNGVDKYVLKQDLKGNGSTLKQIGQTITSVIKCQKPWPDCYDMINQSLEEATEQSTAVTSSKNAGRRSSTMLRNGYLKIGYQLWQTEEER